MTEKPVARPRPARLFVGLGLLCLVGGFALEVAGALLNRWLLFKAGLFAFLMGIPCYLIGYLLGRRKT